jgi:hypothetical protein
MVDSDDFIATLPAPLSPRAKQFFRVWHSWRGARRLPERRDMELDDLGEMATTCLLLDIRGPDRILMDQVGVQITAKLGIDLNGMNYLDLTSKENRAWRAHLTIAQAAQPCGAVVYYWLRFPEGGVLPVEFCGAPLTETGAKESNLILACATGLIDPAVYRGEPVDPDSYAVGDGMRFIDIGFGIPPLVPAARQEARPVQ